MKKLSVLLLFICLLCSACSNQAAEPVNHRAYGATDLSIAPPESPDVDDDYDDFVIYTAPVRTVDEYLDNCESVVKVEIVDTVELWDLNVYYTCRVIEDYWGNLNYYGMDEGYINVYDSVIKYEVGDIAYMFLNANNICSYPHVVYLQLPHTSGYTRAKYENGKFKPIYQPESAVSKDNLYALDLSEYELQGQVPDQAQLLEAAIESYCIQNPRDQVRSSSADSFGEMADQAAESWLIRIDSFVRDVDYGSFAYASTARSSRFTEPLQALNPVFTSARSSS